MADESTAITKEIPVIAPSADMGLQSDRIFLYAKLIVRRIRHARRNRTR